MQDSYGKWTFRKVNTSDQVFNNSSPLKCSIKVTMSHRRLLLVVEVDESVDGERPGGLVVETPGTVDHSLDVVPGMTQQ